MISNEGYGCCSVYQSAKISHTKYGFCKGPCDFNVIQFHEFDLVSVTQNM